ncbi:MAG: class I SAM-dependent methyltransferase [Gammaproteobacteria bacterium]|nr:class I SAM-dependent methyltransferase [Gammaproteobacteria bacterium]
MEPGKHSYMAEGTALLRAAHQVLDADPKILEDPLALTLLGANTQELVEADLERQQSVYLRNARTFAVMRSRYVDDELSAALEREVKQYVILGAGLDTTPYRASHASHELATFEVDHPDTQRWKLEKLDQAGIRIPANLRHVAIDFEEQSLAEGLAASGFDTDVPSFFSWLGVTYYLTPDSVFDTFRFVSKMPPASQITFDFTLADSELDAAGLEGYAMVARHLEKHGEPWLARFAPGKLAEDLRALGFGEVSYFSQEMAWERYLKDRTDGLSLNPMMQLMSAIV